MATPYDFVTMAVFAGLIMLFLERSMGSSIDPHPMWRYLLPAAGCAISNKLGNNGHDLLAIPVLCATLVYVVWVLKPLERWRGR